MSSLGFRNIMFGNDSDRMAVIAFNAAAAAAVAASMHCRRSRRL